MTSIISQLYRRFRLRGESAALALNSAKIVARFSELESLGLVRLLTVDESEGYFDVYGRMCVSTKEDKQIERLIERDGCVCCISEYLDGQACDGSPHWEHADSIGMCIYRTPLSPIENCYITELMDGAIEQAERLLARSELSETLAD